MALDQTPEGLYPPAFRTKACGWYAQVHAQLAAVVKYRSGPLIAREARIGTRRVRVYDPRFL